MFSPELLQEKLNSISSRSFVIAYSGGLDSHVLLHAFAYLRTTLPDLKLRAIHINHGLSDFALEWEHHCESICRELNIPFQSKKIVIAYHSGDSLEEKAREVRYQALIQSMNSEEYLVTAHTQNDQAETLLLQLMRGSGPKGLAGIPEIKNLSHVKLFRPLLNIMREDLLNYAIQNHLKWIEDESNQNNRFDRNFLRNDILPKLLKRWPGVFNNLSRTAQHCAESVDLMNDLADQDLINIYSQDKKTLKISALLSLSEKRQKNVLRRWFDLENIIQPNSKKLHEIQTSILLAKSDATPFVCWQQVALRRYRDNLYLCPMRKNEFDYSSKISWDFSKDLFLSQNLGILTAKTEKGKGIKSSINRNDITIRFRQGGEICQLSDKKVSKPLKKCFQEWGVPTWLRRQVPLLYCGEQLAAVIGYCICTDFTAQEDEMGFNVQLKLKKN